MRLVAPENDYRGILGVAPGPPTLSVAVVIPVYERPELLAAVLDALVAQTDYPSHLVDIVVVDDGSTADIAAVTDRYDSVSLHRQERRGYGAGRARNLGVARSSADVVLFIDADCVPSPRCIAAHMRWHHAATNVVVIGARRFVEPGSDTVQGTPVDRDDWRDELLRRTAGLQTGTSAYRAFLSGNVSVRREDFEAAGGFDETFDAWGGEDTELGWRLFQQGLFFVPDPEAVIDHVGEPGADRAHADPETMERLIPHRFYRKHPLGPDAVPKISAIVDGDLARALPGLRAQSWQDFRIVVTQGDPGGLPATRLPDSAGDPDTRLLRAIASATGEYVAVIDAATDLSPRTFAMAVSALDNSPRLGGVADPTGGVSIIRRREWAKILDTATSYQSARSALTPLLRIETLHQLTANEPTSLDHAVARLERSPVRRLVRWVRSWRRRSRSRRPRLLHVGEPEGRDALQRLLPDIDVTGNGLADAIVLGPAMALDTATLERVVRADRPSSERFAIRPEPSDDTPSDARAEWVRFLSTCRAVALDLESSERLEAWGWQGDTVTGTDVVAAIAKELS